VSGFPDDCLEFQTKKHGLENQTDLLSLVNQTLDKGLEYQEKVWNSRQLAGIPDRKISLENQEKVR